MTGLEIDNFYKKDEQKYLIEENLEFLEWYEKIFDKGFRSILSIDGMQQLINDIVKFYELKYPNEMLYDYKNNYTKEFMDAAKISKMMNMEQLKYRINYDCLQFLECSYVGTIILKSNKDIDRVFVTSDSDGKISKQDLYNLKNFEYIENTSNIETVNDLYKVYESRETNVDYSELKKFINDYKYGIEFRNKVLDLVPYAMIYSNSSIPEYGYARSKSFVRMFNKEYKTNLELKHIDEIMNKDYSEKIEEETKILFKKKKD